MLFASGMFYRFKKSLSMIIILMFSAGIYGHRETPFGGLEGYSIPEQCMSSGLRMLQNIIKTAILPFVPRVVGSYSIFEAQDNIGNLPIFYLYMAQCFLGGIFLVSPALNYAKSIMSYFPSIPLFAAIQIARILLSSVLDIFITILNGTVSFKTIFSELFTSAIPIALLIYFPILANYEVKVIIIFISILISLLAKYTDCYGLRHPNYYLLSAFLSLIFPPQILLWEYRKSSNSLEILLNMPYNFGFLLLLIGLNGIGLAIAIFEEHFNRPYIVLAKEQREGPIPKTVGEISLKYNEDTSAELNEFFKKMWEKSQMVVATGPFGTGKTSLAMYLQNRVDILPDKTGTQLGLSSNQAFIQEIGESEFWIIGAAKTCESIIPLILPGVRDALKVALGQEWSFQGATMFFSITYWLLIGILYIPALVLIYSYSVVCHIFGKIIIIIFDEPKNFKKGPIYQLERFYRKVFINISAVFDEANRHDLSSDHIRALRAIQLDPKGKKFVVLATSNYRENELIVRLREFFVEIQILFPNAKTIFEILEKSLVECKQESGKKWDDDDKDNAIMGATREKLRELTVKISLQDNPYESVPTQSPKIPRVIARIAKDIGFAWVYASDPNNPQKINLDDYLRRYNLFESKAGGGGA